MSKISPTHASWYGMRRRCLNEKFVHYADYGGRGIKICERWLNSFENFLADMGERPEGKTLDRFPNNDGNYEPGNCRWATHGEQIANRRITQNLVGRRFGRLLVFAKHHVCEKYRVYWESDCDCGNKSINRSDALISKRARSCGCLANKRPRDRETLRKAP